MTMDPHRDRSPRSVRIARRSAWVLVAFAALLGAWGLWGRANLRGARVRAGDVMTDGFEDAVLAVDVDLGDRRLELRRDGVQRILVFTFDRRSGAAETCVGNASSRALLRAFARTTAVADERDALPWTDARLGRIRLLDPGEQDERRTLFVAEPPGLQGGEFVRVRDVDDERSVRVRIDADLEGSVRSGCVALGEPGTTAGLEVPQ